MTTIDHLKWRYATKKFDASKLLSEEKVSIVKQAFNLTATSFGLQTISLLVITDKVKRDLLVKHSYDQNQIVDASHLLVICVQDDILDADVDGLFDSVADLRKTPEDILEPYRKDLKTMMQNMSKTERQEWSVKQAYIALGNLMTVCAIERIDACPMEGFISEEYDALLNLKERNLRSVLVLPIGYRAEDDKFAAFKKVRKTIDDAVITL
ncbi:nitroreductase family protein [Psychroserpens ponticola]|uniref:Nitroreductase family protein n=1 Tax=Psychroserpens ponticola TaxID=2932268 RepID=A0ABY7S0U9_9FLAO|nr:nitroreductase family protein [Psychroserpens ponticola]WCO02913.1 nitroreductase family protein [Psychroserpens ponticola]